MTKLTKILSLAALALALTVPAAAKCGRMGNGAQGTCAGKKECQRQGQCCKMSAEKPAGEQPKAPAKK